MKYFLHPNNNRDEVHLFKIKELPNTKEYYIEGYSLCKKIYIDRIYKSKFEIIDNIKKRDTKIENFYFSNRCQNTILNIKICPFCTKIADNK